MKSNPNANPAKIARELRDFISAVIDSPPGEMEDLLTNNAEDLIHRAELALGIEAFAIGDSVIAESHCGRITCTGTVVAVKTDSDGSPIFTVRDQDDDAFDFSIGELTHSPDA